MATIIQEGQMSAPTQGGLFQGVNFWLSMRVPMRSRCIQQIKANGGKVVLSEKDADIPLVDHLKEHTVDTAFSYKFIEKSIQNKKLEDLEDYRVRPTQKKKAKAGGLKGRSTFTQEDDDILFAKLASVSSGHNGNKIYHELSEKYPHHTMHSWRGRWVDHFSKLKGSKARLQELREEMDKKLEEEEEEEEEEEDTQSDEEPEPRPVERLEERFSKMDEGVLREIAVEMLKNPDNEICERLSREHPNYTPEEWRAFFTKIILPRVAHNTMIKEPISKSKNRRNRSQGEEEPIALTSKEKAVSKPTQGVQEPSEPTSSSLDSKRKKLQSPMNTKSPLRTMSLRESPRSWIKEGNKQFADLQPHKSTANSSTGKISPTKTGDRKAVDEAVIAEIPQYPSRQTQKKVEIQTNNDKDAETAALPYDKVHSSIPQNNNQKRKREKGVSTSEQRKRKRNPQGMIEHTPEVEPTIQSQTSRILSPELGESSQKSSPPLVRGKKYDEMSTQALYDQYSDADWHAQMEFPPLASSPTSPAVASPSPSEEKSTPQSKFLPESSVSAWASSPPSSKATESESVSDMSNFLDYCQKKFRTSEQKVVNAIKRTSGDRRLVEVILECDVKGEAPPDLPGIWTPEQDQIILGEDSRVMKAFAEIKGQEQVIKRMEFLDMWNRA